MKAACIDQRRNNQARLPTGDLAQRTKVLEQSGVAIVKDALADVDSLVTPNVSGMAAAYRSRVCSKIVLDTIRTLALR